MSQGRQRKYRCQVTLTVDDVASSYVVKAVDGGWRFEKPDGTGYSLALCKDQRAGATAIRCTCQGHRSHNHCKHADWLRVIGVGPSAEVALDLATARTEIEGYKIQFEKQRGEIAQLWEELNKKHEQLMEEGFLLDQANRTVAELRDRYETPEVVMSSPYSRTADRPAGVVAVVETKSGPRGGRRKRVPA